MSVAATTKTEPLTITPSKVRYSLRVDLGGEIRRGFLHLQRADKRQDGTWMDDPRPGGRAVVPLPESVDLTDVMALLPTILSRLSVSVSGGVSNVRLHLTSNLDADGQHVVAVTIQCRADNGWVAKSIELNSFLAKNQDMIQDAMAAWEALDSQIDKLNSANKWV